MIKLIHILNELSIDNPNITAKKVEQYFENNYNILTNDNEYIELCEPYCEKYDLSHWICLEQEFAKLSQQELNKLYSQMKQLVQKYSNINE